MEEGKRKNMSEIEKLRHSAAHVLAYAVKELFPGTKLAIGPPIENGFYYDFDRKEAFSEEDLEKLEAKMKEIIKADYKFKKENVSKVEAKKRLKGEKFKLELLEEFDKPSFYTCGKFVDLCAGPHVESTGKVKGVKLLKVSGAYWKGDSKNKQLQRIYGTAFSSEKELKKYLFQLVEAEKRNHMSLGKKLGWYGFHSESPGSPFFYPDGAVIYNELLKFLKDEYIKRDYKEVVTPLIYGKNLWEKSGHWGFFREHMFTMKMDKQDYALKPMNCPSHCLIYKRKWRSYKELPLRIADFAALHRNELTGVLGGLTRVRKMSQDDAHLFVTDDQLEDELMDLMDFTKYVYTKVFDFDVHFELSTKPDKAMGDPKLWKKAEDVLEKVLKKGKVKYNVNLGDGAFYGPKIDVHVKDSLGRSWQMATIQVDFQMPRQFELEYDGEDGKRHVPIMIHRAIYGTLERFIGVLMEHYAGHLPFWLAPKQVKVITVTDKNVKFAKEVVKKFKENGLRVELDDRSESIGRKVRDAQLEHVCYMITIGDKEVQKKTLAVRDRKGNVKFNVKIESFIKELDKERAEKRIK